MKSQISIFFLFASIFFSLTFIFFLFYVLVFSFRFPVVSVFVPRFLIVSVYVPRFPPLLTLTIDSVFFVFPQSLFVDVSFIVAYPRLFFAIVIRVITEGDLRTKKLQCRLEK